VQNTCYDLPEVLQPGCNWQYDWLLDTRSDAQYTEVSCPTVLTDKSRCIRL